MKKHWNKPMCTTLMAQELSNHIKVAAWSDEIICDSGVSVKLRTNKQSKSATRVFRVALFSYA